MAGLWETLPASPCSAASDDPAARAAVSKHHAVSPEAPSKRQVLLNTLPATPNQPTSAMSTTPVSSTQCLPTSPSLPLAKRARVEVSPRTTRPVAFDFDKPASPETVSDLPSTLAAEEEMEEKRRALLARLRVIQSNKAKLAPPPLPRKPSPPPRQQRKKPQPDGNEADAEVTVVQERLAAPRRAAQPRRPSGKKASKAAASTGDIIDLDDSSLDISSLGPKKKAPKRKFSSARGTASKSLDYNIAEQLSKRKSSRVRRPRTPNEPGEIVPNRVSPIPTCMSKCKRVQFCKKLIVNMLRDESAKPFSAPVKELWHEQAIPKYFDIISHPMDLGTVKKNLDTTRFIRPVKGDVLPYRFDVDYFADDVRLVFRNAMVYNRAGDFIHNSAHALLESFEKSLENIPALPVPDRPTKSVTKKKVVSRTVDKRETLKAKGRKSEDAPRAAGLPRSRKPRSSTPLVNDTPDYDLDGMTTKELRDRLTYLRRCRVPVMARAPVPKGSGYLSKAALLYSVDMSVHEKKKAMQFVNKICQSKLESFVDMVKKSSNFSEDTGGEFELDFDKLDNKTLRNIEAFLEQNVTGFKTIRSSSMGREFPSVVVIDKEIERILARFASLKAEKKTESVASGHPSKASKSFFDAADANESSSDSSSDSDSGDDSDSSDDDSGDESE